MSSCFRDRCTLIAGEDFDDGLAAGAKYSVADDGFTIVHKDFDRRAFDDDVKRYFAID